MSNKIRAAVRIRPFLSEQVHNGYSNKLIGVNKNKQDVEVLDQSNKKLFHFDQVFQQQDSQKYVYQNCQIDHMLEKALQGYHSTIFAYGQTGSGKTYTMQGSQSIEDGSKHHIDGIIPVAIQSLFSKIKSNVERTFIISVSFLQIYNQKIFDLLNPSSLNPKNLNTTVAINGLRLRWNKDQQFTVENLFVFECKTAEQLMKYFIYGLKNRINASHKLNLQSSRSHSILTLRIQSYDRVNPTQILSSKIELVDLAGSQRIGSTGTDGKLAKESIDINKSLFTLRQVINILADLNKSKINKEKIHVPYRDSKLTSILKQSIGGNSYCLMIACVNPNDNFLDQNISTLIYATKATHIINKPVVNDDPKNKIITDLKKQIRNLNEELGKANQHIEFISTVNDKNLNKNCTLSQRNNIQQKQQQTDIPQPLFKKKLTEKTNTNYDKFSQRLVQSINMVRQLLKSNKQLREQLDTKNTSLEGKDLEIMELNRQNQLLKEMIQSEQLVGKNTPNMVMNRTSNSQFKSKRNTYQTGNTEQFINKNQRNNLNYWNSVEINQFYMNQRGIDSVPTNFNRRQITSAHEKRLLNSRGGCATDYNKDAHLFLGDRHATTAKITKRGWLKKNNKDSPKKILSFYNDQKNQGQLY